MKNILEGLIPSKMVDNFKQFTGKDMNRRILQNLEENIKLKDTHYYLGDLLEKWNRLLFNFLTSIF